MPRVLMTRLRERVETSPRFSTRQHVDAVASEGDRSDEPGRASADDEDLGVDAAVQPAPVPPDPVTAILHPSNNLHPSRRRPHNR